MSFVATAEVNINGSSLQEYVEHVNIENLLDQYPEGRMQGFDEPERGYKQDEIGFRDTETGDEFYVYARWDQVKIGAKDNVCCKKLKFYLQANSEFLIP